VGTGKTMLVNAFLDRLPETVQPVMIANPRVSPQDLLVYVAKALEIKTTGKNVLELMDGVKNALEESRRLDKQVVLLVDDAHLLSDQGFEEIRLLSNLESPDQKLLQILLVGDYGLSHKLNRPEMEPVRQRINVNRFLSPLSGSETGQYIDQRLHQVGSSFASVFAEKSLGQIFKMTKGIPRLINQLCDNALLISLTAGAGKVNRKTLKKAAAALETDRIHTPPAAISRKSSRIRRYGAVLISLGVGVGVAMGWLGTVAVHRGVWPGMVQPIAGTMASTGQPAPGITAKAPPPAIPEKQAPSFEKDLVRPEETKTAPGTPAELKPESKSPGKAVLAATPGVNRLVTQAGETLSSIAAEHYPEDKKWGLVAIILQNPQVVHEDSITAGESLSLPKLNPKNRTMQLNDGLFYGLYGRYTSPDSAAKIASWFKGKNVKFLVRGTKSGGDTTVQRIFLGGYPTEAELEQVRSSLATGKKLP
jgi:type II secretory pathway predicted ATPase ExeA